MEVTGTQSAWDTYVPHARIIWLGNPRPDLDRIKERGLSVELRKKRAPEGREDLPGTVYVVAAANDQELRQLADDFLPLSHAWLLLLVPTPKLVVKAMAFGFHDAILQDASADEIATRILVASQAPLVRKIDVAPSTGLRERTTKLESEIKKLRIENIALREQAHRDDLTGIGNRRSFRAHLDQTLEYAARYGGTVSVVVMDLDCMKQINDDHGHPTGDVLLAQVADVLRSSIRSADRACRLGGDEFAIVMPHTSAESAAWVAERIRSRIQKIKLQKMPTPAASFGVAMVSDPKADALVADDIFGRADRALYQAKRAGKNRVTVDGNPEWNSPRTELLAGEFLKHHSSNAEG